LSAKSLFSALAAEYALIAAEIDDVMDSRGRQLLADALAP
jgi:hypothetical protein